MAALKQVMTILYHSFESKGLGFAMICSIAKSENQPNCSGYRAAVFLPSGYTPKQYCKTNWPLSVLLKGLFYDSVHSFVCLR